MWKLARTVSCLSILAMCGVALAATYSWQEPHAKASPTGEAAIRGSERVAKWARGAGREDSPDADPVWRAELDFAPRGLWPALDGAER
jgi:hypothetical protein